MQSICQFPSCENTAKAKQLCSGHLKQIARGVELSPLRPRRVERGPCSFPDCGLTATGPQGLCNGHRHQQRRGIELRPLRAVTHHAATMQERLDMGTDKSDPDGCWTWTRATNKYGHGRMRDPEQGRARLVHVIAFELKYGPVPQGQEVDHRCRNPRCLRVDHLALATKTTNAENRRGANKNSASGVRNVSWSQGAWMVMVNSKGQAHYGGRFKDLAAAEQAAIALRNRVMTNNLADHDGTPLADITNVEPPAPEPHRASDVPGVVWKANRWVVRVWHNRVEHYGGRFAEQAEAEQAAIALRKSLNE